MIKITPVFGPQEMFDHAPGGAEFAIKLRPSPNDNIPAKDMYYFYTAERALLFAGENNVAHVAQRRIQEAPDPIDLSGDMDAIIEPEFSEWWENYGQLVGSGGGDRERTFAFAAFRYLMPKILGQKQPEPKRWTAEDQKAGRLPEVGGECQYCQSKLAKSVIAVTATHIVIDAGNGVGVGVAPDVLGHDEFMQYYQPIETPDEKAARLEDEFVESVVLDAGEDEVHFRNLISLGARFAYRKIYREMPVQAKDGAL
jgi:hypothetical protein